MRRCCASGCSHSLRSYDQPLARQRFVPFFDEVTMALSDFVALNRVGFAFISDFIALPALRELPAFREVSIHGASPEISGPWSWVSSNACRGDNVIVDN